ncbi:hypothetical protein O0L34_g17528 [Tuta absoluta]|nr:hypothetical protein O0L34_g17528 [Tuta absoluta]
MHRKSIEAAQHLKESGSEREGSDPEPEQGSRSVSPRHHEPHDQQPQSSPASSTTASSSAKGRASPEPREGYDDPEAFRNNSIACLRAKAQEHQARILSSNLLLQVRGMSRTPGAQTNPDDEGPGDIDVGTEQPLDPPAHAPHPPHPPHAPHLY